MGQQFGAYGKMPVLGDFFRLNTPAGFVRLWDPWVQGLFVTGQATYGPLFDGFYMNAPIWRFTLPFGAARLRGVMMPSVDRVGRRFPLTLVQAYAPSAPRLAAEHFGNIALFQRLEDIALACLEDTMDQASLAATLVSPLVSPLVSGPEPSLVQPGADDGQALAGDVRLAGSGGRLSVAEVCAQLAQTTAQGRGPDLGLWSAQIMSDAGDALWALPCTGLPEGARAMGLFDLESAVWRGSAQP